MRPPIEMARQSTRNGHDVDQGQLSIGELQDLAERQRQQIFFNSQELITKQQRFLDMQKKRMNKTSSPVQANQDMYAALLRETYQNHMEKLKDMQVVQDDVESQRFSNNELASELERVREIFSVKQQELASAVQKVDSLTKQLELRKNGVANWSSTPEKLSRRRKIQAARMELDKLRNELSVRNELNGHQSVQLEMQKQVLSNKKQELDQLSEKIDILSEQIQAQRNRAKLPPYAPRNGVQNRFSEEQRSNGGEGYPLSPTATNGFNSDDSGFGRRSDYQFANGNASGKQVSGKQMPLMNGNVFFENSRDQRVPNGSPVPFTRHGDTYVAPDGREFQKPFPSPPLYASDRRAPTPPYPSTSSPSSMLQGNTSNPNVPRSRTDVLPPSPVQMYSRAPADKLPLGAPFFSPKSHSGQPAARVNLDSRFASSQSSSAIVPPSPSSSVSSLSSLSSTHTNEDRTQLHPFANNISEIKENGVLISDQQKREADIWNDSTDFRDTKDAYSPHNLLSASKSLQMYYDAMHSSALDSIRYRYMSYCDAYPSYMSDKFRVPKALPSSSLLSSRLSTLETSEAMVISKSNVPSSPRLAPLPKPKPPTPQKPKVAPKPATLLAQQRVAASAASASTSTATAVTTTTASSSVEIPRQINEEGSVDGIDHPPRESSPVFRKLSKEHHTFTKDQSKDHYPVSVDNNANVTAIGAPIPHSTQSYATSSFADIDKIFETQNDILPYMLTPATPVMPEDDTSEEEVPLPPVVISVPPEDMPPSALVKSGQERRPKRNVELDPYALLLDASLEGELSVVKSVLHKVPNPSLANAEGITALHNAVCGNHKNVVKFLVEIGCDINAPDNNGWTPLHCAAFYNDLELCKFLVEHGACVFAMTYSDSQTPAHKCSRLEENYDACFKYLHDSKEQVGRSENGKVFTLYDYTKQCEDELDFHCGEQMTVVRRGDSDEVEWWWVENSKGLGGYVPFNFLGIYARIAAEV